MTTPSELTPEQWRARLLKRLADEQPWRRKMHRYFIGRHPLAFVTEKWRQAFGHLLEELQDNWLSLIVESEIARLRIQGFQPEKGSGDAFDPLSQKIWEENDLDTESEGANEDALVYGKGFVLVSPPVDGSDVPTVTVEDALSCVVEHDPAVKRIRLAGLKAWDEEGYGRCTLYLPDGVHRWRTVEKLDGSGTLDPDTKWEQLDDEPLDNPSGVVQLVELRNVRSRSDIEQFLPAQDAINKLMCDMMVGSEFAAFRQRMLTGVELPEDLTETERQEIKAAISRLWLFENKDVKAHEFSATELSNFTEAIKTIVQHVASRSNTPPHYLLGTGSVFPSGESLKAAEVSLVAKCGRRIRALTAGWREVDRTAKLMAQGTTSGGGKAPRGSDGRFVGRKPIWADPEYRTEGERVDALIKMRASTGLPRRVVWKRWGAEPQEIEEWMDGVREEAQIDGLTLGATANGAEVEA